MKFIVVLFFLSLPLVTTRLYASDEIEYFSWLRSWTFDRDVNFENEYRYFYETGAARNPSFHETFLERTNEAGRRFNFAPVGCAILWAPFYAAGHVAARLTGAPADGFSAPYVAAVAYGSAVYGMLAVVLSASMARRLVGRGGLAAIVVWIGTPLVYYMYITPPFSHASSAFAVSLFLFVWLRVRQTWSASGAALLGATAALMAMVREQDIFFVVGPAVDYAAGALRRPKAQGPGPKGSLARRGVGLGPWALGLGPVIGALSFALVYSPQLLAYKALNGHYGPSDFVSRKMTWTSPHALAVLFSPEHGLFAWTPLAFVAIAGLALVALRRVKTIDADAPWIGGCALLMVAAQVYVTGAVESWTLEGSFGQRRFVALTPLLTLGVAALWAAALETRRRAARAAFWTLAALSVWWNVGLMAQFGLHMMDRSRLTLRDNAWNTFIVLPRELPGIAIRYLTDRSSFYNQPRR